MFIVEHEINYINSWLADSVSINNVDIKNRYIAVMPEPINNNYYIYFESSSVDASINISMTEQALPIELQSYNHHIEDNAVHLEWTTATEIESSRFLIKRNSELIGEIDAHGTTTSEHNYSWQDIDPPEGELKYEIFEVSYSGNIVSIFTINLNYQSIDQLKLNLYPNPVNTAINIALETNREKNVKIKMYDILGKIVKESDVSLSIGNNVIKLDLSSLATGIYSVVINNSINKKIVVLK